MTRHKLRIPGALVLLALLMMTSAPGTIGAEKSREDQDAIVNVNTAGLEELMSLPGMGEAYARRVIAYREKYGPFEKVEDLLNVRGIGDKTLEKIRRRVTVGEN
jgi:competence protein ComEA